MNSRPLHNGLSTVELVTTLTTVGVLLALAVPLVSGLDQQQRSLVCLNNLRQLGQASLAYAAEDPRGQIIGLHRNDVLSSAWQGWTGDPFWTHRTVLPFLFGGHAATVPFQVGSYPNCLLMEEARFGAMTRPLSIYLAGGGNPPNELFHCPADTGFPDVLAGADVPPQATNVPCSSFLGNSYRRTSPGIIFLGGGGFPLLSITSGALGHTPAEIGEPDLTALYVEPIFYSCVRETAQDPEFPLVPGWHGVGAGHNVAYCDGSARPSSVSTLYEYSAEEEQVAGLHGFDWYDFLYRCPEWRLDTWPAPGAAIITYYSSGLPPPSVHQILSQYHGWPFDRISITQSPFRP